MSTMPVFKNTEELFQYAKENHKNLYVIGIDLQVDFVTGALANTDAQKVVPTIVKFLRTSKKSGANVHYVFTKDTHYTSNTKFNKHRSYFDSQEGRKLPVSHCIFGTDGWKIVPQIETNFLGNVDFILKTSFGYKYWRRFAFNPNSDIVIVYGFVTDICVLSNVISLKTLFPEVEIYVVENCCAGTTPENHNSAINVMRSCQVNII